MPYPDKLAGAERAEPDGIPETVRNRGGIGYYESGLAVDVIGVACI